MKTIMKTIMEIICHILPATLLVSCTIFFMCIENRIFPDIRGILLELLLAVYIIFCTVLSVVMAQLLQDALYCLCDKLDNGEHKEA